MRLSGEVFGQLGSLAMRMGMAGKLSPYFKNA